MAGKRGSGRPSMFNEEQMGSFSRCVRFILGVEEEEERMRNGHSEKQ